MLEFDVHSKSKELRKFNLIIEMKVNVEKEGIGKDEDSSLWVSIFQLPPGTL